MAEDNTIPETGEDKTPGLKPVEKKRRERFYWVKFHARSDPSHKEDVELSVNGETLILQREKRIALPERFLECADHAKYIKFDQKPGEDRKVVAQIRMFPYDRLERAMQKDFAAQFSKNKKQG